MKNSIKLFADDTKVCAKITSFQDALSLQEDLDQLHIWTDQWMLRLNTEKCKVMHIKQYSVPLLGVTHRIFADIFGVRKLEFLGYHTALFV